MSLKGSFEIRNKMEGFRFFLFLSGDNNECVIAQDDGATDNLTVHIAYPFDTYGKLTHIVT